MTKLLFISGSTRKNSMNKKLAQYGAKLAIQEGIETTFIDLLEYPMPIYNGDDEMASGLPENAIRLKQLFRESDGFFIASPEYNSSISALLKNTLDWISRVHEQGETPLVAYKDKVAAISSASPGALGGLRGLVPLRMMLGNIGVHVIPNQVAIKSGHEAFNDQGELQNPSDKAMFENVIKQFVEVACRNSL